MDISSLMPEVSEIVRFVLDGYLLKPNTGSKLKPWMTRESSFGKAEFFATDQHGDKCQVWGDLVENSSGEVMGKFYATEKYKKELSLFTEADKHLNDLIWDAMGNKYDELILNSATGFFSMLLESRFFAGKNDNFLEKVFQGYQTGGWPCGWIEGDYPNGKMVIYMPG